TFVFDALPLGETSIILETDRVEEFAPIKNADSDDPASPASDSPATSKALQTERAARWLERRGVAVARGEGGDVAAVIEIRPLTAVDADDLMQAELPGAVEPGAELLL